MLFPMNCNCCNSDKVIPHPLNLTGYRECLRCGLIFKEKHDGNTRKNELISHYSSADPHESVAAAKQNFFKKTLEFLNREINGPKKSILDIGCGYGYFIDLAAKQGWDAYGTEIVKKAVKCAEKKIGKANVHHGTLIDAKYNDNYFDVNTFWDVLVEVDDPFEELKECYRILREGGKIGIRVRNSFFQRLIYKLYLRFKKIADKYQIKKPYVFHQFSFNRKAIFLLLVRVGFTNIAIKNSPLSKGDPYNYTKINRIVNVTKNFTEILSEIIFFFSFGKLIVGPSLLIWAEKPKYKSKGRQIRL